jgi:hypothetical protein
MILGIHLYGSCVDNSLMNKVELWSQPFPCLQLINYLSKDAIDHFFERIGGTSDALVQRMIGVRVYVLNP